MDPTALKSFELDASGMNASSIEKILPCQLCVLDTHTNETILEVDGADRTSEGGRVSHTSETVDFPLSYKKKPTGCSGLRGIVHIESHPLNDRICVATNVHNSDRISYAIWPHFKEMLNTLSELSRSRAAHVVIQPSCFYMVRWIQKIQPLVKTAETDERDNRDE